MIYVPRPYHEELLRGSRRSLVFGRRKTGKTTLVKHVLRDWLYVYVKPSGEFFLPEEDASYDLRSILPLLRKSKVIVDEFHRAPREFVYRLQAGDIPEEIVLVTSTLHLAERFTLSQDAPLKGLFTEIPVPLLEPLNLLRYFKPTTKEEFEKIVFYQEPTQIGKELYPILEGSLNFSLSLLSEVLREEELSFSRRLEGILRVTSTGESRPSRITSKLYSMGLIPKENTGLVSKYIDLLVKTGFLERIRIYKSKRYVLRHVSPLTAFAFYVEEKYGFYEGISLWGKEFLLKVFRNRTPLYIEQFVERFFSELWGLKPVKILEPEVDIALMEYKKLKIIGEVKWKNKLTRREIREIEEKLDKLDAERKILVVPEENILEGETGLEVWDVEKMSREASRKPYA